MKISNSTLAVLLILTFISGGLLRAQDINPQAWPNMTGYWKFQDTTQITKATVGNDLQLVGVQEWVEGPNYGDTASRIGIDSYYKCFHSISPNGGGDSVNRYTLMFDFKVLNFDRWHAFQQTDSTNMNDAECFIENQQPGVNKSPFGTATTGYTKDSLVPNTWYRLVISVCLDSFYRYYINGDLWLDTNNQKLDGRFALTPLLLLFADQNQEDDTIDVASVAIFDTCLTHAQVALLGGLDPCIHNPLSVDLGVDKTLCMNHTLTLDAGAGFTSYHWSTGDTTQTIVLDSNNWGVGTQAVWVKVNNIHNCEASDTLTVNFVYCTGLNSLAEEVQFSLYPNPVNDFLYLSLPEEDFRVEVISIQGDKTHLQLAAARGTQTISVAHLASGVYFLRISNANHLINQRFIKL